MVESSSTWINKAQFAGTHDGTVIVLVYNWSSFLEWFFKRVPNIKKYHHFRFSKDEPSRVYFKELHSSPKQSWCYWKIAQSFPLPHSCQPNWIQQGWAKNERSIYSVRSGPFASLEQRTWLHKHLKLFLSTQEALYFENLQVFIFALICMYKFWALTHSTMIYHYIATNVYWGFRFKLNEIINRWISSPVWLFTLITLPRLNWVSLTFNPEWIFIRSFSLLFNLSLHSRHCLGSLKLMEFFFFFW